MTCDRVAADKLDTAWSSGARAGAGALYILPAAERPPGMPRFAAIASAGLASPAAAQRSGGSAYRKDRSPHGAGRCTGRAAEVHSAQSVDRGGRASSVHCESVHSVMQAFAWSASHLHAWMRLSASVDDLHCVLPASVQPAEAGATARCGWHLVGDDKLKLWLNLRDVPRILPTGEELKRTVRRHLLALCHG